MTETDHDYSPPAPAISPAPPIDRQRARAAGCYSRRLSPTVRFSVGAVNVRSGNFVYFDTTTHAIGPEHIMASAALPPGLKSKASIIGMAALSRTPHYSGSSTALGISTRWHFKSISGMRGANCHAPSQR
jgi:hypothetical protein